MTRDEARLQQRIVLFLQSEGLFFWSTPNEGAGGLGNGDNRARIRTMQLIGMGLRPGIPDLFVLMPNVGGDDRNILVGIEVKTPTGRVSPAQKTVHGILRDLGIPVYVVRSLEEVEEIVRKYERSARWKEMANRVLGKFYTFFKGDGDGEQKQM